ncbi:hypothetical protein AB1Y20_015547 [Prymnesium parvum]|uniref:tRNA-uridine aminocarboxypropyltransferase n=1 Tax=Prymnesium parvum TaxID=97485 RepID=A0AB34K1S0_PRYPA
MDRAPSEQTGCPEPAVTPDPAEVDYDTRYRKGWAYGKAPSAFLVETAQAHLPAGKALDIVSLGEGEGRNAVYLAALGHRCLSIDRSEVGLAKVSRLAEERGVAARVSTLHACVSTLELGVDRWDAILSIHCPLPSRMRQRLHRSCVAALRCGGLVVAECFAPRHAANSARESKAFRGGPADDRLVSYQTLTQEFEALEVLVAREVEVILREGKFHRGPAVLTQFVARRRDTIGRAPSSPSPTLPPHFNPHPPPTPTPPVVQPHSPSEAAYRASIDRIFAASALPPHAAAPPLTSAADDQLLASAAACVRLSCAAAREAARCRYCWVAQGQCLCAAVRERVAAARRTAPPRGEARVGWVRWVVLSHPHEFLRATSTAKLAPLLLAGAGVGNEADAGGGGDSAELLVLGNTRDEARLDALLRDGSPLAVLFPGEEAKTVARTLQQAFAAGSPSTHEGGAEREGRSGEVGVEEGRNDEQREEAREGCGEWCGKRGKEIWGESEGGRGGDGAVEAAGAGGARGGSGDWGEVGKGRWLTVLVPDGTWEWARAIVRMLHARSVAQLPLVALDEAEVSRHHSALLEALRPGAGRGRLSTMEACALFLSEAAGTTRLGFSLTDATVALDGMTPLLQYVRALATPADGEGAVPPHPHAAAWVAAIVAYASSDRASAAHAYPAGLRRCAVCGAALATTLRMQRHLSGRRHCQAVAAHFLRAAAPDATPDHESVASVFEEFSTRALAACVPEPPDVAMDLMHGGHGTNGHAYSGSLALDNPDACAGRQGCI